MTYKPLENVFTKNGFVFELVKREGDVALFARKKPAHQEGHFEVVVIQRHNGYEIAGVKIEPAETYPSNEQWGIFGFTYHDKARAFKKFYSLVYQQKNVDPNAPKKRGRPKKKVDSIAVT